ncbi:MAG: MFS transporter [Phycisphaerae bacterium]|nr:MFS transporter [Phycisphaerae bacterium]
MKNTRDLVTISLAFFFAFVGPGACQPFVIDYLSDDKGLSLSQASLVLSTVYFTFMVFRFFIGFVIDVVGLNRSKVMGVATYVLFPLILYQGGSFPVFMAGSVLWGIGAPMLWTSSLVQILNTSAPSRYGTSTGIVRGTVQFATFVGAYVLAAVYAHRGYPALLFIAAGLGSLGIVAMLTSPTRHFEREKPDLRKFVQLIRNHEAKAVCAFLVCSGLAYGVILNGFKSHIELTCGKAWLQYILPVFFLSGILASYLGGRICDRIGRWPTFAGGFAIGAAGMLLAWAFAHPAILMLSMVCIGTQFSIVPLTGFAWIGDNTSPADRASIMGYVFCFRDLGVATAIQLCGVLAAATTTFLAFSIVSVLCTVLAVGVGGLARPRGTNPPSCP